jgi:hypothetical protein
MSLSHLVTRRKSRGTTAVVTIVIGFILIGLTLNNLKRATVLTTATTANIEIRADDNVVVELPRELPAVDVVEMSRGLPVVDPSSLKQPNTEIFAKETAPKRISVEDSLAELGSLSTSTTGIHMDTAKAIDVSKVKSLKNISGSATTLQTWDLSKAKKNLDIGIPISARDAKLPDFAKFLGSSIREFRQRTQDAKVNIRLLITRYPGDVATDKFRQALANDASLDMASVIFVNVTYSEIFNRAAAINSLHRRACHSEDCVLSIADIDLQVGPRFIRNALLYVAPKTVYFPIVWSEFNPEIIKRVETLKGPLDKYTKHRGLWRDFGFGMYAISGTDATSMLQDTNFVGWGGEDNDFHRRVGMKNWTIVREHEPDLVHVWHPKICKLGVFVEKKEYRNW